MKRKICLSSLIVASTIPLTSVISCGSQNQTIPNKPKVDKTNDKKQDDSKTNRVGLVYKNKNALLAEDKYWQIKGLQYRNKTHISYGKNFYVDKSKNDWNNLTLDEWYDTYDTTYENILKDKYHVYNDYGYPREYNSKLPGTQSIYASSQEDPVLEYKEGNNANPFRGIYSGDKFYMYSHGRKAHVESTAEMVGSKEFSPILKSDGEPTSSGSNSYSRYYNNWEHVSPATMEAGSFGGSSRDSYDESRWPREFAQSTGDLHNLRPSWAGINQPRSNYSFGIVEGEAKKSDNFGNVDFEIGTLDANGIKIAEPRVNVRGDIARIMFFMHDRYHVTYDSDYYKLMLLWAKMDPVTEAERILDDRIAQIMGYHNDYVTGEKKLPYDEKIDLKISQANNAAKNKIYAVRTK